MIDPSIEIMDLDPFTWHRLEEVWSHVNKPKKKLFILEDSGTPVRAVLESGAEVEPGHSIDRYFSDIPDLDRILILTCEGLNRFSLESQKDQSPQLDTDLFISRSEKVLYETEGIQVFDRSGRKEDFWSQAGRLVGTQLEKEHTVGVVLIENERLFFHVVLHFEKGSLQFMTTLDHFSEVNGDLESIKPESRMLLEGLLDKYFAGKSTLIMMEKAEFYKLTDKTFI